MEELVSFNPFFIVRFPKTKVGNSEEFKENLEEKFFAIGGGWILGREGGTKETKAGKGERGIVDLALPLAASVHVHEVSVGGGRRSKWRGHDTGLLEAVLGSRNVLDFRQKKQLHAVRATMQRARPIARGGGGRETGG